MGLLEGKLSVTRMAITDKPEFVSPDFEAHRFKQVPGQEHCTGVEPYSIDEDSGEGVYEYSHNKFMFKLRVSTITPDKECVKAELQGLVKAHKDVTGKYPKGKDRKELEAIAKDSVMKDTSPRSKIIECMYYQENRIAVLSTSDADVEAVTNFMASRLDTVISPVTYFDMPASDYPMWLLSDLEQEDVMRKNLEIFAVDFALNGIHFETAEKGSVKLENEDTKVTLSNDIGDKLTELVAQGYKIRSAKCIDNNSNFYNFDFVKVRIGNVTADGVDKTLHTFELAPDRLKCALQVYDDFQAAYINWMGFKLAKSTETS